MKVLVYPKAINPYQDLLYSNFDQSDLTITYLRGPENLVTMAFQIFILSFSLISYRLKGYRILHLHWLYPLDFPGRRISPYLSKVISTLQTNIFLVLTKLLGYKLVWTVHDLVPHDAHTLNDVKTTQRLFNTADKLILLSSATIADAARLGLELEKSKISIIPHGNYIDSYANTIGRLASRRKLHLKADTFVFLFFGRIEPYKNIPALIASFKELSETYSNITLVIAGKASNVPLQDVLNEAAKIKSIRVYSQYIEDEEVQIYYNAADVVVCPFNEITNSGSILLAASFGKPIIAPLLGAIHDMPKSIGIFYDPTNLNALIKSMQLAAQSKKLNTMSSTSYDYALSLSWDTISKKTYQVYYELLARGSKPKA